MARIGDEFRTGETAPVSGVYRYVRHSEQSCGYTPAQREIPLSRGEIFPPHARCYRAIVRKLVRFA